MSAGPVVTDPRAIHAAALAFVRRGLSVIPIPRPRPGVPVGVPGDGKTPALPWREFQQRLPTEDEICAWFSGAPMNLAVVTGAISGVVVVDIDAPDAHRWVTTHLPYSPWQTQTAKGWHVFYRHPGVPVTNRARIDTAAGRIPLDVRGDGGYVIAGGSLHASGRMYVRAGDWRVPREAVPRFWPGWLVKPTPTSTPRPNVPRPIGNIVERARRYLAAIPRPEIGHGSDTATLSAACRLTRGFGLNAATAESLLWEWCGGRPGWTRDWVARKVDHAERYGREPIGGLR